MQRRPRQISLKECYAILNLEKGADLEAVKHAYRRRAFELHPDLNPGNPQASRDFQLLNEAYVALTAMLKPAEEARKRAEAKKASKDQSQEKASTSAESKTERPEQQTREEAKAEKAYAEQDVLRDLLNDPFARRVFEDIYSELNRQQASTQAPHPEPGPARPAPPRPEPKPQKEEEPLRAQLLPPLSRSPEKGVAGMVKDWLRRQIDEEQTLALPGAGLVPGRKIRLKVRRGFSDEVSSIEVTLPPDFMVGKPIRLRGLGRRVGPWQGDLYLTINAR